MTIVPGGSTGKGPRICWGIHPSWQHEVHSKHLFQENVKLKKSLLVMVMPCVWEGSLFTNAAHFRCFLQELFLWEIAPVKTWAFKRNFQVSPWPPAIMWYWERAEDMSRNSSTATCSSFKTSYSITFNAKYVISWNTFALKYWLKRQRGKRVKFQHLVKS